MSPEEFARARVLIRQIALARPLRRTHRLRRDRRGGALDVRALVRSSLATGGDPVRRAYRSRSTAPRKLVLLLDISGSMEAYARALAALPARRAGLRAGASRRSRSARG